MSITRILNYQNMSCLGRFFGLKAQFDAEKYRLLFAGLGLALLLAPALAAAQAAAQGAAPRMATHTMAWQQVQATRSIEGLVQAERQSTIAAQTSGRITQILFRPGDKVQQGQVIMRIDPSLAQQQVAGAQAQLAEAQVALSKAQSDHQRYRELLAKGFVSQAQFDGVAAQYRAAQARVQALQAGSSQAGTARAFADVTAPYSGVMAALHVELGETASPGMPLATGFDPAQLRVSAQLPQTWGAAVQAASLAWIEIPGQAAWLKAARVQVLPAADPRTHSTEVRVYLPENATGLLPGQFVRLHFATGSAQRLTVPAAAVLQRSELTAVYVLTAKGRPQLRQVRLGQRQSDGSYEILAGLRAGEQVALDPIAAGMP